VQGLPGDKDVLPSGESRESREAAGDGGSDVQMNAMPERRGWFRAELLAGLEIAALTGLAFTRPVLDAFGRSPETFLARDAGRLDVILFGLGVALVPAALLVLVGLAFRLAGRRVRRAAQLIILGGLAGAAAWRLASDVTAWAASALAVTAVVGAVVVVALRWRVATAATFLRLAGAISVVFLLQFLFVSPSSDIVLGRGSPSVDEDLTAAVTAATGDQPPPIVMIVFDALPTTHLLDGNGRIDAELYPNFARLADTATWYRNYTTVSSFTFQAVPSMLTGIRAPEGSLPDAGHFPENFFTLFAGTHEMQAVEQITRLCPPSSCERGGRQPVSDLFGDASQWWRGAFDTGAAERGQVLPGELEPDRGDEFAEWIDEQDFRPGDRPGLWFYHLVLPHEPWDVLPDLARYRGLSDGEPAYGLFLNTWLDTGAEVGLQRQLLQTQAADRMLGQLFDRLGDAGTYDDALIVVAGDHGQSFVRGQPLRGVTEAQYEEVVWAPLLVKAPGQDTGRVDDTNLQSIDVMPILAETLGIDLPWKPEGVRPQRAAEVRDPGDKDIAPHDAHQLPVDEATGLIPIDGRQGFQRVLAADVVSGSGEHAVWQRTDHGHLVGRAVDDLPVADEPAGRVAIEKLDAIEQQGEEPPMLEVVGHTDVPRDEVVVYAVNGLIAGITPATKPLGPYELESGTIAGGVAHALLIPDPFRPENDVTAYLVDGAPGSERLSPLTVTAAR
jgi:hypothetical protein